MKRKESWPEDLHEFFESRATAAFTWGINDCCIFAADAIQAMTGEDPATEFRGKYTDEAGAAAAKQEIAKCSTTEAAVAYVAEQNGWAERASVLCAQRGDLVLVPTESGDRAAGIVYLNGREACFVSTDGLHRIPLRECVRAWSVL